VLGAPHTSTLGIDMASRRVNIALAVVALLAVGALYAISDGAPVPTGWKQLLVLVFVVGPLMLLAQPIFELVCGAVGFAVCAVLGKVPGIGPFFRRQDGDAICIVGAVTIFLVLAAWGMVSVDWRALIDA
jgi:hypothetical protein